MVVQALALGVLAGFAIWDGRVFGQMMLERPIVLGPLVGLILGDLHTGIIMGSSIELVMMGVVAIGAAVPADTVSGSILATAFAIMSGLDVDTAVALALPIATLGQMVGILDRTLNLGFARLADRGAENGDASAIAKALWGGAGLFWLSHFTVVFLGALLGSSVIGSFVNAMPAFILHGFTVASGMLPSLGIAILMTLIFDKTNAGFLFVGFVLSALLGMSTTGVAVVGGIIAYVIYQTATTGKNGQSQAAVESMVASDDDLDGEL